MKEDEKEEEKFVNKEEEETKLRRMRRMGGGGWGRVILNWGMSDEDMKIINVIEHVKKFENKARYEDEMMRDKRGCGG